MSSLLRLCVCVYVQVVLQVVISFIVEAFVFKIQATQKKRSCEKHKDATSCECVRGETAIKHHTLPVFCSQLLLECSMLLSLCSCSAQEASAHSLGDSRHHQAQVRDCLLGPDLPHQGPQLLYEEVEEGGPGPLTPTCEPHPSPQLVQ